MAAGRPIESPRTPTPGPRKYQSLSRSNGRANTLRKPRSKTLTITIAPSSSPNVTATTRLHVVGSVAARPITSRPSSGMPTKAPSETWLGRFGATSASQTTQPASDSACCADHAAQPTSGWMRHVDGSEGLLRERAGQQDQCRPDHDRADPERHERRQRDGQRDSLQHRDHDTETAAGDRRGEGREDPAQAEVDVAHGSDRQDPPAEHGRRGDAEHSHDRGVDLHVEARAAIARGVGRAGNRSVDSVEKQGDRRRDDQPPRPHREVGHQGRHDDRETHATEPGARGSHPVRGAHGAVPSMLNVRVGE